MQEITTRTFRLEGRERRNKRDLILLIESMSGFIPESIRHLNHDICADFAEKVL